MEFLSNFRESFWNEDIWLPPNTTWKDRIPTPENGLPNFMDLWTYPFAMALFFSILRFWILNPLVFSPIALYLGFKNVKPKSVIPNSRMEKIFQKYRSDVPDKVLVGAARSLDWSQRKVERWLRARKAMNFINMHTKFIECSWQLLYYSGAVALGIAVLYDKLWLLDVSECWRNYPHHKLDKGIWWYYMVSLGFYWSMTLTHFMETRRKDFYQMFFHHLITIALMIFSFTCNFSRVGSLIIIVHDVADIPLQMSKLLIYLKWKKLCDAVFAFFSITWIVTRCFIFPFRIVASTMIYAADHVPMHPVYWIFNVLLSFLVILHYYWTYFILRMICKSLMQGDLEDERSSSEEEFSPCEITDEVTKEALKRE